MELHGDAWKTHKEEGKWFNLTAAGTLYLEEQSGKSGSIGWGITLTQEELLQLGHAATYLGMRQSGHR